MRGNQLVRERWVIRAIEVSPNGLSVAEIAKRGGEHGSRTDENSFKAYSKTGVGFFVIGDRCQ